MTDMTFKFQTAWERLDTLTMRTLSWQVKKEAKTVYKSVHVCMHLSWKSDLSEWFYADSTQDGTEPSILCPWQLNDWLMIELFGLNCAATRWRRQEGALHQRWTHKLTSSLVEFLLQSWRSLLCSHSLFRHFHYQSAQRNKTKPARNNWLWRDSLSYKAFSCCRLMQTNRLKQINAWNSPLNLILQEKVAGWCKNRRKKGERGGISMDFSN